ncbi:cyp-13A12, partial [Pristionchus pacificus]
DMITLLVALATLTGALYFYFLHQSRYFARRGMPFVPPASLIFGNSFEMFRKNEPRILKFRDWTKKYGKTYGIKEGATNLIVTSDLEIVNEVFVKQFDNFYSRKGAILGPNVDTEPRIHLFLARGARWKRLRNISAPSFSIASLKKIRPIVEDSVLNMVKIMEERHLGGEQFNIHDFYCEYTMDTIGRLVMGQKESLYFNNPKVPLIKQMFMRDFDLPIVHLRYAFPWITPVLRKILLNVRNHLTAGFMHLRKEIQDAVEERMRTRELNPSSTDVSDFIDLFLNAYEDEQEVGVHGEEFKLSEAKVSKSLTIDEVISQAFVFILAGFDTTANALAYTSWLLACNPSVMRKCQEEIEDVCGEESISYEDINNLRYLEATCKETLRFYPLGAFANSRQCMNTTRIGDLEIEKGTDIAVDTFTLHFDEAIWGEDAKEFKPERWLEDRKVQQAAYLPFGAGPRICIGMRLAMMEEKMALAHLLRRFDFLKGTEDAELKVHGALTLTPVEVPIRIVKRQ